MSGIAATTITARRRVRRSGTSARTLVAGVMLFATLLAADACAPPSPPPPRPNAPPPQTTSWPVTTREHVDLWLHGFAMLQVDTTTVPFFRRDYRQVTGVLRASANALTMLDANRERLAAGLRANPRLVNAQFVAMYYSSWEELRQTVGYFLQADGDARRANSRSLFDAIAILAVYFPTAADRDWLRLFMLALDDERTKFYHAYWAQEQQAHLPALQAVDSLWTSVYRPKFQRLLTNSGTMGGSIVLSLPLDGEGRTLMERGTPPTIAVAMPDGADRATDAIYVLAHEVVASVVNTAIADNTTPNDRRQGANARWVGAALVRAGELLLERVAPELVPGYMRYYLQSADHAPSGDLREAFTAVFSLPPALVDGIGRQLDLVLGGI